jgi:tRNA-dihydrouridine synthase A
LCKRENFVNTGFNKDSLLCVAPMMAWTDRHCRYLHRLYAPSARLFTEMITTGALLHGGQMKLLDFSPEEHPIAVQLGGNDPEALSSCARLASERGYDEINLNVGCPSDRVQRGTFGACLMREPNLVADCVRAMQDTTDVPITVKCRLGIDSANSEAFLDDFIGALADAGCPRVYLHARIAVLGGLSPAQNRTIPPLQPERARRVKRDFPELQIVMNGGITSVAIALEHLAWADGVMVGRAAYHNPDLLSELDTAICGTQATLTKVSLLARYRDYVVAQLDRGERLHSLTRHLLSSCNGLRGARRFRQLLSDQQRLKTNDIGVLDAAIGQVFGLAA